jgi:hypothetical protein
MSGAPEKAVCFGLSPGQLTTPSEPVCEPLVQAMLSGAILAAHDESEGSSLCSHDVSESSSLCPESSNPPGVRRASHRDGCTRR